MTDMTQPLSHIAVSAAASTHLERLARADAALNAARAVLADMSQHSDAQVLIACVEVELHGGMAERLRARDLRMAIEGGQHE